MKINRIFPCAVVAVTCMPNLVQATKPVIQNVVVIIADDMGYHLSGLGTKGLSTPNIDRLMRQGVTFTNAFSVCASSAPSRGSLLTGMYPHSNGHWRNTFSQELSDPDEDFAPQTPLRDIVGVHEWVKTLPEILNEHGYYTAIMRKFHLSYPWKYPYTERSPTRGNTPESYRKDVLRIIKNANGKPFFIQANLTQPHRPWPSVANGYKGPKPAKDQIELFDFLPDIDQVREDLVNYYVNVMVADSLAGAVVDAIRESGNTDRTLIIFTSDQGPGFHRAKASAYYAGSHIPLIVSGKGLLSGKKNKELVSMIDLMPTILECVDIPQPKQIQGKSLMPLLNGDSKQLEGRDYIYTTHNSHGPSWAEFYPSRAIFNGRYYLIQNLCIDKGYALPDDLRKNGAPWFNYTYDAIVANKDTFPNHYRLLMETLNGRPEYELYDMKTDHAQMNNIYGQLQGSRIAEHLKIQLTRWREQTGDNDALMEEMIASFKKPIPFGAEKAARRKARK